MTEVISALCGIWMSCKNIQKDAISACAGQETIDLSHEMLDAVLQKISARVITYLWEHPTHTEKVFEEISNLSTILGHHVVERVQQHYNTVRTVKAVTYAETKDPVAENDYKKATMILKFCSPAEE